MLVKQELSTDDARKLLRGALDKLDQYKLDLLDANHHCRKLQTACQKLTDERILLHTQVTDAVAKAHQQASAAQQELSLCKLRLEHAEQALYVISSSVPTPPYSITPTTPEQPLTPTSDKPNTKHPLPTWKQNVYVLNYTTYGSKPASVKHGNRAENRATIKAFIKVASSHVP